MREFREEIKEKVWAGKWYDLNRNINPRWASIREIRKSKEATYVDKTIAEIANELGLEPLDALMEVLMTDPYTQIEEKSFDSSTKKHFYKHPAAMIGTDTFALDTEWVTENPPWFMPSENSFGGFATYFRDTVREKSILTIEEAVWKACGLPAEKFKIQDRGVLKAGRYADIVIMDIENIAPKAGPLTPNVYPKGIEHVIVNGVQVVKESQHTGTKPGKILYRE